MPALAESTIAVIGLGLMGGSFALALRGKVRALYGIDRDTRTLAAASPYLARASDQLDLLAEANVVVLAAPVRAIITLLEQIVPYLRPGTLIIDLGSVKAPIAEAMRKLPLDVYAIAGHPMCGKEISGFAAAQANLYHGCTFVLCDCEHARPNDRLLAASLARAVGGVPLWIDPVQHDRAVAAISHLPYLLSVGLMAEAHDNPDSTLLLTLASTGFRDTTRLAGSDPTMMGDVVALNHSAIREAWQAVQAQIERLLALFDAEADLTMFASETSGDSRTRLAAIQNARREWADQFARKASASTLTSVNKDLPDGSV